MNDKKSNLELLAEIEIRRAAVKERIREEFRMAVRSAKRHGVTQHDIARAIGVHRSAISQRLSGRIQPTVEDIAAVRFLETNA